MLAADDVEGVHVAGERAGRVLAVARRRADGVDDLRLAVGPLAHGVGDFEEGAQLQGRLRDDERRVQRRQRSHLARVAHHVRALGRVTLHADHFRVVGVADDHHVSPLRGGTPAGAFCAQLLP